MTTDDIKRLREELETAVYADDPQAVQEKALVDDAGPWGMYTGSTQAYDRALGKIRDAWSKEAERLVDTVDYAEAVEAYGRDAILDLVKGSYLGPDDAMERAEWWRNLSLDSEHGEAGSLRDLVEKYPEHVSYRSVNETSRTGSGWTTTTSQGIEIIIHSSIGEQVLHSVEADHMRPGQAVEAAIAEHGDPHELDKPVRQFRPIRPQWAGF